MFHYQLTSLPNFDIDNNILDELFIIMSEHINKQQNGTLNIVFLDTHSIQKLNNDYRQKDTATDVLSFHYHEDFTQLQQDDIAWEIVLCEPYIITQWQDFWLGTEKEFYKLLIHSTLHILWYDHENDDEYEIMSDLEKQIWWKIFEK